MGVVWLVLLLIGVTIVGALIKTLLGKVAYHSVYSKIVARVTEKVDPQQVYVADDLAALVSLDGSYIRDLCESGKIRAQKHDNGWQIRGSEFVADFQKLAEEEAQRQVSGQA